MDEIEISAVRSQATDLWRSGANIEAVVRFMRDRGLSQGHSVEVLHATTGIGEIEAQIAVIYSDTWRDQWERNVKTNEQLMEALTQLTNESVGAISTDEELEPSLDPQAILRCTIST